MCREICNNETKIIGSNFKETDEIYVESERNPNSLEIKVKLKMSERKRKRKLTIEDNLEKEVTVQEPKQEVNKK